MKDKVLRKNPIVQICTRLLRGCVEKFKNYDYTDWKILSIEIRK